MQDDSLSQEEHFTHFMKSMGFVINNAEMDKEAYYNQIEFFTQLLDAGRLIIRKILNPNHAKIYVFSYNNNLADTLASKGQYITESSNLTGSTTSDNNYAYGSPSVYCFFKYKLYFDEVFYYSSLALNTF